MKKQILILFFAIASILPTMGQTYRMIVQPFYENNYALINPAAGFLTGNKFFQNTLYLVPGEEFIANQTAFSSGWDNHQIGVNIVANYYKGDGFGVNYASAYYNPKIIETEEFSLLGGIALQYDPGNGSSFNLGVASTYNGFNFGINYVGQEAALGIPDAPPLNSYFGVFASYDWDINTDWKLSPLLQYSDQFSSASLGLTASYKQFSLGALCEIGVNNSYFNYASIKVAYELNDAWSFGYAINGYKYVDETPAEIGIANHALQVAWKLK